MQEKLITQSENVEALRYQHKQNIKDGWKNISGIITLVNNYETIYLIKYIK